MTTLKTLVPTVRVPLENDAGRLAAAMGSELPKSAYRVTPVNAAEFSSHKLGPIRHTFDQHPLMQMPQLLELARELQPLKGCRFIDPRATESSQLNLWRRSLDGHDIDEVFNRIEAPGSWVALYNIENIPRYKDFLLEVLGAAPGLENLAPDGRYVPRPGWRSLTRFERRGERLGHGVYDLAFRRREPGSTDTARR